MGAVTREHVGESQGALLVPAHLHFDTSHGRVVRVRVAREYDSVQKGVFGRIERFSHKCSDEERMVPSGSRRKSKTLAVSAFVRQPL